MKRKQSSTSERKALNINLPMVERCRNPWNAECESTDIVLYIFFRGERLPICSECWSEIASANIEWEGD
jgi:hypothetical protein